MPNFSFLWTLLGDMPAENKRRMIVKYAISILQQSDWTQLPDSGLTLQQQLDQQAIRAEWMALDDPSIDPDTVTVPPYPMTERP